MREEGAGVIKREVCRRLKNVKDGGERGALERKKKGRY